MTEAAPTPAEYLAAATSAAGRFDLDVASITLMSASENLVYDVLLHDGRHVAMRLHRPGYNSLAELRSEVQWVQALSQAGIAVPHAIPSVDGGYYVPAMIGPETRHVGVVAWIDGESLGSPTQAQGPSVVTHYRRIGQLAAQIRSHSSDWQAPAGFVRRVWDADGLLGDDPLWGRFWQVDTLTDAQRDCYSQGRDLIRSELAALSKTPERFGLIHADLHLGNVMSSSQGLTVIDFDDAGFGWFMYELAVALHPVLDEPWFGDARAALLAGYGEVHPLSTEEVALIETFLVLRCLIIVGWLDDRRDLPIYTEHAVDLAVQAERMTQRYLGRRG